MTKLRPLVVCLALGLTVSGVSVQAAGWKSLFGGHRATCANPPPPAQHGDCPRPQPPREVVVHVNPCPERPAQQPTPGMIGPAAESATSEHCSHALECGRLVIPFPTIHLPRAYSVLHNQQVNIPVAVHRAQTAVAQQPYGAFAAAAPGVVAVPTAAVATIAPAAAVTAPVPADAASTERLLLELIAAVRAQQSAPTENTAAANAEVEALTQQVQQLKDMLREMESQLEGEPTPATEEPLPDPEQDPPSQRRPMSRIQFRDAPAPDVSSAAPHPVNEKRSVSDGDHAVLPSSYTVPLGRQSAANTPAGPFALEHEPTTHAPNRTVLEWRIQDGDGHRRAHQANPATVEARASATSRPRVVRLPRIDGPGMSAQAR